MNDRARAAVARRCVNCNTVSSSTMNAPIDVILGSEAERAPWDGGRSARVDRATHDADFDVRDELCSARRPATAQDGSRAAAMNRVRPQYSAWLRGPLPSVAALLVLFIAKRTRGSARNHNAAAHIGRSRALC